MSEVMAHVFLLGRVAQGGHGEAAFHDLGFGLDQRSLAAGDFLKIGHLFTGGDDALLYADGGSGFQRSVQCQLAYGVVAGRNGGYELGDRRGGNRASVEFSIALSIDLGVTIDRHTGDDANVVAANVGRLE